MIHHNSDLFYGICKTVTADSLRQIQYISLIPNCFDIYFFSELKNLVNQTSSALSLIMIYMV